MVSRVSPTRNMESLAESRFMSFYRGRYSSLNPSNSILAPHCGHLGACAVAAPVSYGTGKAPSLPHDGHKNGKRALRTAALPRRLGIIVTWLAIAEEISSST